MMRTASFTSWPRWGALLALLWGALLVLVPYLPEAQVMAYAWSFRHLADVPLAARVALAAACLLASTPAFCRSFWRGIETAERQLRGAGGAARRAKVLSGIALALLFWTFRSRNFELGDSAHLLQVVPWDSLTKGYHVSFDEPLELLAHSGVYRLLYAGFGASAETAYALVSLVCGVAAVALIVQLGFRAVDAGTARVAAVGLCLSAGAMQLYFGYVENYTIVSASILLYLVLAVRAARGALSLLFPALALGVSMSLHLLAGWLLPSLFYLWCTRRAAGARDGQVRTLVVAGLAVALPLAATVALLAAMGYEPSEVRQTHLWKLKFHFLLDPSYPHFRYSMWSMRHALDVLNEIVLAGLPGLLAVAVCARHGRPSAVQRDAVFGVLLSAACFLQLFAATWHADLGPYRDWDLFAVAGMGWSICGAYLLVKTVPETTVRAVLPLLLAIALSMSATWVARNTQARAVPVRVEGQAHLQRGSRFETAGRLKEAEAEYRRAISFAEHAERGRLALGRVLLIGGRRAEALQVLKEYLRVAAPGPDADRARAAVAELERPSPRRTPARP